eukprot:TRINITY_DN11336_c0_g9_i2.p1 TRINITY_DN11336_c0_g9~~TRINITY_DN11336_c0_g9_i2.p1  ORF type:complete len:116 (-),score=3.07 TRINITY_DN11336_c0_g9_i2:281-628(-)
MARSKRFSIGLHQARVAILALGTWTVVDRLPYTSGPDLHAILKIGSFACHLDLGVFDSVVLYECDLCQPPIEAIQICNGVLDWIEALEPPNRLVYRPASSRKITVSSGMFGHLTP